MFKHVFEGRHRKVIDSYSKALDDTNEHMRELIDDLEKALEKSNKRQEELNIKVDRMQEDVHHLTQLCNEILGISNVLCRLKCVNINCQNRFPKFNMSDKYCIKDGKIVDLRPEESNEVIL